MIGTTAALLGSAALGAGASIFGSSMAANAQSDAAEAAINAQQAQYGQIRRDLMPFQNAGLESLQTLQARMPYLTSAVQPLSAEGLERLPGYQFTQEQGMRGVNNALTASGLSRSGAAVKAADRFNTGLAQQTYNTQANYVTNLDLANRQNEYNRLMELVKGGQSAAAGTGAAGITTGQGVANSLIQGGNAQAAGYNAMGGAAANALGQFGAYNAFANMSNGQPVGQTGMYGWQNPDYGGAGVAPNAWYNQ